MFLHTSAKRVIVLVACQRSTGTAWIMVMYVLEDGLLDISYASVPTKLLRLYLSKPLHDFSSIHLRLQDGLLTQSRDVSFLFVLLIFSPCAHVCL